MARQDQTIRYSVEVDGTPALKAVADGLHDIAKSSSEAAPQAQKLLDEMVELSKLGSLASGLPKLQAQLQETGDALALAKIKAADLQKQFDATGAPTQKLTNQLAAAKQSVTTLDAAFNAQTAGIKKAENALAAAGVNTKNLDAAQRDIAQSLTNAAAKGTEFATSIAQAGKNSEKTGGAIHALKEFGEKAGEALKSAGEHALEFGKRLAEITGIAAVITTALAALSGEKIFEQGIEQADKFAESILKAATALGEGEEGFDKLAAAANAAADATGVSGKEAADALAILAKGAGSADAALQELQPTLVLSQAAQIDTATAANLLATALEGFGLQAQDSARVIDLFAKTASTSRVDLAELGDAFAKIAPDAKAAGVSIEESAALFGALADNGIRGKKAVGDLSSVFQALSDPTSKLAGDLSFLGLSGKSLTEIIEHLAGNSKDADRIFRDLGGSGSAALRALVSSAPSLQKLRAALGDTSGAAQTLADKFDKELGGAFDQFKNSFLDAARTFSTPLLKPLAEQFALARNSIIDFKNSAKFQEVAQSVGDFIGKSAKSIREFITNTDFTKLGESISSFVTSAGKSLSSFGSILSGVGTAASAVVNGIGAAFNTLQATLSGTSAFFAKQAAAAAGTAAVMKKLSGASDEDVRAAVKLAETLQKRADDLNKSTTDSLLAAGHNLDAIAGSAAKIEGVSKSAGDGIIDLGAQLVKAKSAFDNVQAGVETYADKIADIVPNLQRFNQSQFDAKQTAADLEKQFGKLGITLQKDLVRNFEDADKAFQTALAAQQKGVGTVEDTRRAYAKLAEAIRAKAADGDAEAKQASEDLITEKGLVVDLGEAYDHAASQQRVASEAARAASDQARERASLDAIAAADAANKVGNSLENFEARGTGLLQSLDDGIKTVRDGFAGISDEAAKAFDAAFKGFFDTGFSTTGTGADRVMKALADATAETNKQLAASNKQLSDMIANIDGIGDSSTDAFGNLNLSAINSIGSLEAMKREIEDGTLKLGLLGKEDLAPLQAALDAAIQRANALKAAAEAADDKFKSIGASLQDELDQANGNLLAIEKRRFDQQIKDITDAAKAAGKLNTQEFQKEIANAKALHDLKLKQIEQEQNKQNGGGTSGGTVVTGGGGKTSTGRGGVSNIGGGDVHIHLPPGLLVGTTDELAQKLGPAITKELKRQQALSIKPILGK